MPAIGSRCVALPFVFPYRMAKLTDRGTILVLFCSASLTWRFARDAFAAPLLTVRDVAALLRVSTRTVYLLCAQGRLADVRMMNAIPVGQRRSSPCLRGPSRKFES